MTAGTNPEAATSNPLLARIAAEPVPNRECKIAETIAVHPEVAMTRHLIASLLLLTTFTCLAAPQEATPQRTLVGQGVMASQITTKVAPIYPPLARAAASRAL